MKNRLQFNRLFQVFRSREEALAALDAKLVSPEFTPLIGEPIVLRYLDGENEKQVILAVGKSTGGTIEYHTIDTKELEEKTAELSAVTSAFSATTEEILNALTDDISFISAATSAFSATTESIFDAVFGDINFLTSAITFVSGETSTLSGITEEFSGHTVSAISALTNSLSAVSGSVDTFSAATLNLIEALEGETSGIEENLSGLSGATTAISGYVFSLSAGTVSADQALSNRVTVLESKTINGVSAITITGETNKLVYLVIDETEKVLSQNSTGLKTTLSLDYSDSAREIYLKGLNGEIISTIDANDFIKDGMVDSVVIDQTGRTMIITFNTDAGKQDIEIRLDDIFDPDNYYTKDETNANFLSASTTLDNIQDGATRKLSDYALSAVVSSITDSLDTRIGAIESDYATAADLAELNIKINTVDSHVICGITVNGVAQTVVDNIAQITVQTGSSTQYTAGSGISLTNDEISVKLANKGDTNYLKLDGDGLYLSGITALYDGLNDIEALIPVEATSSNQLADKDYVSSAIAAQEETINPDEIDALFDGGGGSGSGSL